MQQPTLQDLLQVELINQSLLQQLGKRSKVQLSLVCQAACNAVRSEVEALTINCAAGDTGLAGRAERLQQQFPNCRKLVVKLGSLAEASKQLPEVLCAAACYGDQLTALVLETEAGAIEHSMALPLFAAAVHLPSLQQLSVQCWEYPASTFEAISKFPHLAQLQLSTHSDSFDYHYISPLSGLTALKQLALVISPDTVPSPSGSFPQLSNLPQLTSLHLITDDNDLKALSSCSNLQDFDVAFSGAGDAAALGPILSEFTGLTRLIIKDVCSVYRPAPTFAPALRKLSKLQILDLYELTGDVITAAAHISTLTNLTCTAWAETLVEPPQQQRLPLLPHLRVLTIKMDVDHPEWPFYLFPNLTSLCTRSLAAGPLSSLVQHCKQLACLDIGWIFLSHESGPAAIRSLSRLPVLRQLHASLLAYHPYFLAAVASLTRVTLFELRFSTVITLSDIATLLPMRRLSVLKLKLCRDQRLAEGEAMTLAFGMSQLDVLEVQGLDEATQEHLLAAVCKLRQQVGRAPELEFA